jgi:hypothetical protein
MVTDTTKFAAEELCLEYCVFDVSPSSQNIGTRNEKDGDILNACDTVDFALRAMAEAVGTRVQICHFLPDM